MQPHISFRNVSLSFALGAAFLLGHPSARADLIPVGAYYDLDNGYSEEWFFDDEEGWYVVFVDWGDGGPGDMIIHDMDPNPEGDSNPSDGSKDAVSLALEYLKRYGSEPFQGIDLWTSTPFGLSWLDKGKAPPTVIDPWDDNYNDAGMPGFGGSAGGIDLNGGSLIEQIKGNGRRGGNGGDDGDGDGDDANARRRYNVSDDEYPADPEYVNPIPVTVVTRGEVIETTVLMPESYDFGY